MVQELMIELHASYCGCGGGSWVTGLGQCGPHCAAEPGTLLPPGALLIPIRQWQAMGRPRNADVCGGVAERRRSKRYRAALKVRLQKWTIEHFEAVSEETVTEDLGIHGARVRSQLNVELGTTLILRDVATGIELRAEVRSMGRGADNVQRLSLAFLEATFPEDRIPTDAPEVGQVRAN